MFTEFTKSYEANQNLAKELVAQLTTATTAFTKTVVDVNTQLAETFKTQAADAYKNFEAFKVPGFDAYTAKSTKK